MTPSEEKRFRDSGRQVPEKTILRLATTADGRSSDVSQFCDRLSVWIPLVSVLREDAPGQDYPFMRLPNGVRYMGIPAGNEVGAFVEALSGKVPALPDPLRARVASVRYPAGLDLYRRAPVLRLPPGGPPAHAAAGSKPPHPPDRHRWGPFPGTGAARPHPGGAQPPSWTGGSAGPGRSSLRTLSPC